jgi:hypothetical protein
MVAIDSGHGVALDGHGTQSREPRFGIPARRIGAPGDGGSDRDGSRHGGRRDGVCI